MSICSVAYHPWFHGLQHVLLEVVRIGLHHLPDGRLIGQLSAFPHHVYVERVVAVTGETNITDWLQTIYYHIHFLDFKAQDKKNWQVTT